MPPVYITSEMFKEGSEKEWSSKLGALDWDSTRIVFTKRTLIEFLRYTGTSVDPNFRNISRLPCYADFGRFEDVGETSAPEFAKNSATVDDAGPVDTFKPSRRVRSAPGGEQTFTFEDDSAEQFDVPDKKMESLTISDAKTAPPEAENTDRTADETSEFRPTRRVRTGPGGPSSMFSIFGDEPEAETFKPTRRVRERPGGTDSISQIF